MQSDSTSEFADRLQSSFAQIFGQVVPALLGAAIIIFAGYVLAKVLQRGAERALRKIGLNRLLALGGRASVVLLSVVMAWQELGIATEIVTTAFAILFGAVALAMALSFGLGNRDLAGEITREWYERYRREREETLARERAADAEADTDLEDTADLDVAVSDLPPHKSDSSPSDMAPRAGHS